MPRLARLLVVVAAAAAVSGSQGWGQEPGGTTLMQEPGGLCWECQGTPTYSHCSPWTGGAGDSATQCIEIGDEHGITCLLSIRRCYYVFLRTAPPQAGRHLEQRLLACGGTGESADPGAVIGESSRPLPARLAV